MRTLWQSIRSRPALRKPLLVLGMLGAVVAAFYWGRFGAPTAGAQSLPPKTLNLPAQAAPSYTQRVVAYIHDNIPISREDLGEYLIARYGQERVEFLVNRRIVEMECQAKGVYVTDGEVDAQFQEDLKGYGPNMTAADFTNQILKRFNKTLYEWREDVVRPKIALQKLCKPLVHVTQEDLTKAYEARYGPKVQCRMIVFAKGDKHRTDIWAKISQSEVEFSTYAKQQFHQPLASKGGEIPPIHKHFGDPNIERAAFALQPSQVTHLMEMPDGTSIVLKCDKHLPADGTKSFDSVRLDLEKEMRDFKLAQKIPEHFADLRKRANPRVLITNQVRQEDMERDVVRSITTPPTGAAPRPTGPSGN
jgi:hypothetical protein